MKRIRLILAATLCILTSISMQAETDSLLPYPIDTVNGVAVYKYPVEKSIGLYRISVNFGVSQDEILKWNPSIAETGLRYGETVLLIPVKQVNTNISATPSKDAERIQLKDAEQPKQPEPQIESAHISIEKSESAIIANTPSPEDAAETEVATIIAQDNVKTTIDNQIANTIDTLIGVTDTSNILTTQSKDTDGKPAIKLALLLPLQANTAERDANMDRFIDFYEGVILALNDLQSEDSRYELYVYDIDKSQVKVQKLVKEGKLQGMNAVIGPAYPAQVLPVGDWVKEEYITNGTKVPVLLPFVNRVPDIKTNPMLLQFNASREQEANTMATYLKSLGNNINVILVEARDTDIPESIRLLRKQIDELRIPVTYTTINNILNNSLGEALKDEVENILLFNTEKYSNLNILMPNIISAAEGKQVTLLSQYSWQNEKIPLPYLFVSNFAKNNPEGISSYEASYAAHFGHEHSSTLPRYDILGYDVTRALIAWLKREAVKGIQSDIVFEQPDEEGGWLNSGLHIVRKAADKTE